MPLRVEIPGPVDLFALHRRSPADYPFLLQSAADHPQAGRYDLLFAFPSAVLELRGTTVKKNNEIVEGGSFFGELSAWFAQEKSEDGPSDLPFLGGWFVFLGYEAAGQIERRLKLPRSPHRLADALAVRCPAAAIYDRKVNKLYLISEREPVHLERLRHDLESLDRATGELSPGPLTVDLKEDDAEHFLAGVDAILEYLRAGDVFQVNLSRAWRARLRPGVGHSEIYHALRRTNPAPFAGLLCWRGSAVLSSSPERLVQVSGKRVQTRPIAGTHPRGTGESDDKLQLARLLASLKERAEHIMLIDLERNDLGRVCKPGSVEVSELMTTETYAHVHHIVSNVTGALRAGIGPGEVLSAVFPGGTITGCPKVRAMEIIAELEHVGRGPYTGAMGYLCRSGRLDMNILIRSLICEEGTLALRAGAGIVADSNPQNELAETRAKARGLLLALGAAV
jgi:anthranilate synthase component 1